jgi:hypothetical protein
MSVFAAWIVFCVVQVVAMPRQHPGASKQTVTTPSRPHNNTTDAFVQPHHALNSSACAFQTWRHPRGSAKIARTRIIMSVFREGEQNRYMTLARARLTRTLEKLVLHSKTEVFAMTMAWSPSPASSPRQRNRRRGAQRP